MKIFKIRASAAGSIMAGSIGLSDPQKKKLQGFQDKVKSGKELTALQSAENDKLLKLEKNPTLPAGVKTFCQTWVRENVVYNRRKEFRSKYTDKGNFCESDSIEFLNKHLLCEYDKNEEYKENEWMTGTPDIITDDEIIDIKNSYDTDTFPLFDFGIKNKDYYYQLQVYMALFGKSKATLAYTLMNAPFHLIEREAKSQAWNNNVDYDTIFSSVHSHMTFGDVEPKHRYKLFNIDFDPAVIEKVKARVELCRTYINELIKELEK
tara:strand:+ start:1113 stop:1904 length:792 start_codon:yes stop_codon:yes gene_type:complete